MADMFKQYGKWNPWYEAAIAYDVGQRPDGRFGRLCPAWVTDLYLENYWATRFERYWERATCPVLFLPSAQEAADTAAMASLARCRALLRDSQVTEIPGADHALVLLDQPAAVAEAVLSFIGSRI